MDVANRERKQTNGFAAPPRCLNCDLDMQPLSPTQFVWACSRCNFRVHGNRQVEWWDKYAQSEIMYDDSGYLIDA